MNVQKPLIQGSLLKLKGGLIWIAFQYKKIPKFYFQCGIIFHGEIECLQRGQRRDGEEDEYRPWLYATSPKRWMEKRRGLIGDDTKLRGSWSGAGTGGFWQAEQHHKDRNSDHSREDTFSANHGTFKTSMNIRNKGVPDFPSRKEDTLLSEDTMENVAAEVGQIHSQEAHSG